MASHISNEKQVDGDVLTGRERLPGGVTICIGSLSVHHDYPFITHEINRLWCALRF